MKKPSLLLYKLVASGRQRHAETEGAQTSSPIVAGLHASAASAVRAGQGCIAGVVMSACFFAAVTCVPAQSVWKDARVSSMFSDKRASSVGDVLTILVQENNTASKDNSIKTAKNTSIDAAIATFLYSPAASGLLTKSGQLPALKTSAKTDFDAGGQINNTEKMAARIAVRVVDVLPNGNLVIEGRRTITFARETQDAVLRGVVRSEDITANNNVYSYNIADATIKYTGQGAVSETTRKGWFTRLWEFFTPF
ncbi:MAG: flagellar basal body L-ring protein FlgH [Verrucomicrobiota bacterium]